MSDMLTGILIHTYIVGGTDYPPTYEQQTLVPGNRILTFPMAIAGIAIGYNNTNVTQ